MSRRILSTIIAAVLLFGALPILPAFASALSQAGLKQGAVVFPGTRAYTVSVKNTEPRGTLGTVGVGKSIDAVRIILPSAQGVRNVSTPPTPPVGWAVTVVSAGAGQWLQYDVIDRTRVLAPQFTLDFPFEASVNRPKNADRKGEFEVMVSSDGGKTESPSTVSGTLTTDIRVLQVTALKPIAPDGANDGEGTAGQRTTWELTVLNHAKDGLEVLPRLDSSNSSDNAENPTATVLVAGQGGTATVQIPVTLGSAASDRVTSFFGSAKTTDGKASTHPANGVKAINYLVQAAPFLEFDAASFEPNNVRGEISYTFTVSATKRMNPTLTITDGTLRFKNRQDGTVTEPVALQASKLQPFADTSTPQVLEFAPYAFPMTTETITNPDGTTETVKRAVFADGKYDAIITLNGVDGNNFTLPNGQLDRTIPDILELDNLIPNVKLDDLGLPTFKLDGVDRQQTRVKDGDAVRVKGEVDDPSAVLGDVGLEVIETGEKILCPSEGEGALTESSTATTKTFQCTIRATYASKTVEENDPVTGLPKTKTIAAKTVRGFATAADLAGNPGGGVSNRVEIDNQAPTLEGANGWVFQDDRLSPLPVVAVKWVENFPLIGGCSEHGYTVDDQLLVERVVYSNGESCVRNAPGPDDNVRVLILKKEIRRDGGVLATPNVKYDPEALLSNDDAHDAAGSVPGAGIQKTINRLAPVAPTIVEVKRNDGTETAYQDEDVYYTRFARNPDPNKAVDHDNDPNTPNQGPYDLTVTVSGGLRGDTFEILSADGQSVLASVEIIDSDGKGTLGVPLSDVADGTVSNVQEFQLRLVSPAEVPGDLTPLKAILDKELPAGVIATRDAATATTVTQEFNEPVLGANFAKHWVALHIVETDEGPQQGQRGVKSVSGSRSVRTLDTTLRAGDVFDGTLYTYTGGIEDGYGQYEDFAGNRIVSPAVTGNA